MTEPDDVHVNKRWQRTLRGNSLEGWFTNKAETACMICVCINEIKSNQTFF